MKNLSFTIHINATKERVWNSLWQDEHYRDWTSVFSEGSHFVADEWSEGSKVLFLNNTGAGMVSRIARLVPYELISFRHLGEYKNGQEDYSKAKEQNWEDGLETYILKENGNSTELTAELGMPEEFAAYFEQVFPSALQKVKAIAENNKIVPFLWFDNQVEEAVNFYTSVFPQSKVLSLTRHPDGKVFSTSFQLGGQKFSAFNAGPMFRFTPAVSLYVTLETLEQVNSAWARLSEGGNVMMPIDTYPWSERYGWVQDRFGLSWQLSLGKPDEMKQIVMPCMLFTGAVHGRAEEALHFYDGIFKNTHTDALLLYGPGEGSPEGTVKNSRISLNGRRFMLMDGYGPHDFQFTEAFSFMIECPSQEEIDYYWNRLLEDGGMESQCGWLKDKFGVSWQVVPPQLLRMLSDADRVKSNRAMEAMMQMQKLDLAALEKAYSG